MTQNIKWLFFDVGSTLVDESIAYEYRIDNDIVPAKKLGMHTIWIKQGFGRYWHITDENEKADYEVRNLTEVCSIILRKP